MGMRERIRALLPRTRRGWRRTVQLAVGVCTLALLPATWMYTAATPRVRDVADVPAAPVAVVFGTGLVNGVPSPYLAHRLAAAARLYRSHKVDALLVTGDNSRDDYNEPGAMRGYLVQHGVPADRVVLDYAGFDTWDSCARAKRIFGVNRAILVSQSFHIRRALDLCQAAGISAYGVGVDEPHDTTWYYGGVREVAAASKAVFNVLVRPDPSLLGPKDDGIAVALRAAARR
jgi:vancomycin permeability regulator SanA